MKKYQVKFLATKESPILGTDKIITSAGVITTLAEHLAKPNCLDESYYLMRPFLVDLPDDIKKGDYVMASPTKTGYYIGFENDIHDFSDTLENNEGDSTWSCENNFFNSNVFKIIGEVSPLAKWVKEGDLFTAEGGDDDLEINPLQIQDGEGNIIYLDVADKVVTRPVYQVRCYKCKRFH